MADYTAFEYTDGDVDTNRTDKGPTIAELVKQRVSRRTLMGALSTVPAAALVGCGSDSGGGIAATTALQVSAANNQTSAGRVVALTGSAVVGTPATVTWTQISGPTAIINNANSLDASFVAPGVTAATPLEFQLTATNAAGDRVTAISTVLVMPGALGFAPVAKSMADVVAVPAGYSVTVLYRMGDPINSATSAYANNGTDGDFAARAGDQHDGMYYFGLAASGTAPDATNNARGVLCLNHENIVIRYLHPNGPTTTGGVRPVAEAIKEIECHGVSMIEVSRAGSSGTWSYNQTSTLNRRITPFTPMQISGPARGAAAMRTAFSPDGTAGRGTINNCANGFTPWNTYVTCEENWAGYFRRAAGDAAVRTAAGLARSNVSLARYGRGGTAAGNNGWTTATPVAAGDTRFAKFDTSAMASAPVDGTGDFRNEINQYGWCVEIDPFEPNSVPRKRTAMGRMNHEGAWPGLFIAGRRPAWYQGDDAQNEYLYKFVSTATWVPADATATNRLATGDKYLDAGTLYVAKFNADGSGEWLPLVFGNGPLTSANAAYAFVDQADVLINTRLAADAVGATRMDRPEWTAVNPANGEMYLTLTNNSSRTAATTDAANPRAYTDMKQLTGDQINSDPPTIPGRTSGNPNGHIIRLREAGDTTEAVTFTWDIYVFGSGADLNAANVNLSGLDATNDFSSPDGLWFGRASNASGIGKPLLWVQTDDGAYTDVTNCMMLVGQTGNVGDGSTRTITNTITPLNGAATTGTATTRVGAAPGTNLRRFMVGPKECEITGIDSTPDGRTLFVNIQHPGEDTQAGFPNTFPSNWPASQTNPAAVSRPRSATIVITKDDGGVVGL